jgi:hypothetical protein
VANAEDMRSRPVRERSGMRSVAALGSPVSGAEELQPVASVSADVWPEIRCSSLFYRPEHSGLTKEGAAKSDGAAELLS